MGTVRLSLLNKGTLKKLSACGATSYAVTAAEEFREVVREAVRPARWRPTVTPTVDGAEMLMTRPPSIEQATFDDILAAAVVAFRSVSPTPLFVS